MAFYNDNISILDFGGGFQSIHFPIIASNPTKIINTSVYEPFPEVVEFNRKIHLDQDDIKFSVDGFEKGHLAPAADMKIDSVSVREAAYMSNISPQKKDFNGREWRKLENHVRSLAKKNEIYVTTAAVLSCDLESIGQKNKVSVPKLFYKIIYDDKNKKMTAYLMPNKKLESFKNYRVTVDSIEILTGIDFYYELDDILEEKLESKH